MHDAGLLFFQDNHLGLTFSEGLDQRKGVLAIVADCKQVDVLIELNIVFV